MFPVTACRDGRPHAISTVRVSAFLRHRIMVPPSLPSYPAAVLSPIPASLTGGIGGGILWSCGADGEPMPPRCRKGQACAVLACMKGMKRRVASRTVEATGQR